MSASTTTKLKLQAQLVKPKRRRSKETTITTSAAPSPSPSAYATSQGDATDEYVQEHSSASSFSKFNTALTAGLLNPLSPPPPPQVDLKTRSSPTLFEMMSSDVSNGDFGDFLAQIQLRSDLATAMNGVGSPQYDRQRSNPSIVSNGVFPPQIHQPSNQSTALVPYPNGVISSHNERRSDRFAELALNATSQPQKHQTSEFLVSHRGEAKQVLIQRRLSEILAVKTFPGTSFNDSDSSDLKLTLSSKDGVSVDISVHKQILVACSRFFKSKLSEKESSGTRTMEIEIKYCDDMEVYVEMLRLMYCKDLRRRLMKEDVDRVLGILKISAAIGFDACILSCLEYLEAAPWSEDEEVSSLLWQLQLEGIEAEEVLRRISHESTSDLNRGRSQNEEMLLKLLQAVLEGKDEKARREMKALVAKMLRESSSQNDLRKESLYIACKDCLKSLRIHFLSAASANGESSQKAEQIVRQADNLHWLLDILIDRQIADDFLTTWASLSELSKAHCKVPVRHRFEISRITARFFVAIGKRQMLASKEARCMLLETWLVPFYEDFAWMKRASKGLDRNLIEEGLSNTILTLPLNLQQEIFMSWFDRYLNSGEDCPNIQRGFEVWWRRAFLKRDDEADGKNPMRIVRLD